MAGFLLPSVVTVAVLTLSSWLVPFLFRRGGALVGSWVAQNTEERRRAFLTPAKTSSSSSEDGEWEKVEDAAAPDPTSEDRHWKGIVGFFHPFCNAGGGGERVLWAAIRATQLRWPQAVCVVYTGDHDASKEQIIKRVQDRFNITLEPSTLHFLYLTTRHWVLASTWPRFTLLGQSLGSLLLALDAFSLLVPDIFVDTMGYAFAVWLCKFLFPLVPTGAYVHYPTISTDMLDSLDSAASEHGVNAGAGKGSRGQAKRLYWRLFANLYSRVGGSIDVVMTNSSWTQSHIQALWGPWRRRSNRARSSKVTPGITDISVVFPPVAVEELEAAIDVSLASEKNRSPHLLYIAQFRPEKNHTLIVSAFASLISSRYSSPSTSNERPKLVLVGSVRDSDDATRVYKLRLLAHELQVKHDVEFVCDASWEQVLQRLRTSSVGVNGMWNEHFGIGVVEYQAAGLISVVNDSGGPRGDIVVEIDGGATGFHASTAEEYAEAFGKALDLSPDETMAMRQRARKSAKRFTEKAFAEKWIENMETLVALQKSQQKRK